MSKKIRNFAQKKKKNVANFKLSSGQMLACVKTSTYLYDSMEYNPRYLAKFLYEAQKDPKISYEI